MGLLKGNTLIERNIYNIEFSFTQSIVGEAIGESEEAVREGLLQEFADAPDFKIVHVTFMKPEEQLELHLVPSTPTYN